jgi:dTDP-glucose 4,6-dehydratase
VARVTPTICISGGAGFAGHHLVEHVLRTTGWNILVLDRLTYASGGFDRLRDISAFDDSRVRIFTTDLTQPFGEGLRRELGEPDYIVHMAAETHVDRSIEDAWPFVQANVIGTYRILEWARTIQKLRSLVYFSTDEVFGPAPIGVNYREWDRYSSSNPYAATKAGGEELCMAWANTYGVPVLVTHTMNIFAQRQHPEKWVPLIVRKILRGEQIQVHADPTRTFAGSRFYIHARNVADAVLFLLHEGKARDKYNIVGEREIRGDDMVRTISQILGREADYVLVDAHSSRPGHDLRYALDGSKLAGMGWAHPKTFDESLTETVTWMVAPENKRWLDL